MHIRDAAMENETLISNSVGCKVLALVVIIVLVHVEKKSVQQLKQKD